MNVIKQRLSKLFSLFLAVLIAGSSLLSSVTTITAYADSEPIRITLNPYSNDGDTFIARKNQKYILDKKEFINCCLYNCYTKDNSLQDYNDVDLDITCIITHEDNISYMYPNYIVKEDNKTFADITDNGDGTLTFEYKRNYPEYMENADVLKFTCKPKQIANRVIMFEVNNSRMFDSSNVTTITDLLAVEDVQHISMTDLRKLIGTVIDANTYYYYNDWYLGSDYHDDEVCDDDGEYYSHDYENLSHNNHIKVLSEDFTQDLSDDVTRMGAHTYVGGSGYVYGFLLYVGDEISSKYEIVNVTGKGKNISVMLSPVGERITFRDPMTNDIIGISTFDENTNKYSYPTVNTDSYDNKAWYDCTTTDCTNTTHGETSDSNVFNKIIETYNTAIENSDPQPYEGSKTFYVYKNAYDLKFYDISLIDSINTVNGGISTDRILKIYNGVMSSNDNSYNKPHHNITNVYLIPEENTSDGQPINRDNYTFYLSDTTNKNSTLSSVIPFIIRMPYDSSYAEASGGVWEYADLRSNDYIRTDLLQPYTVAEAKRLLYNVAFTVGASSTFSAMYFEDSSYADRSYYLDQYVHENRKTREQIGLDKDITVHLYGYVNNSKIIKIDESTESIPQNSSYINSKSFIYEYDPIELDFVGLSTPYPDLTVSSYGDKYKHINDKVTITPYSSGNEEGTVSTNNDLLVDIGHLTAFLPSDNITDEPTCVDKGSISRNIRMADNVLTTVRGVSLTSDLDPLGHIWHDEDWELVADVDITQTLFTDAENSADLDFAAYNSNTDYVYKRECSRAHDAYQIQVVNHKHVPNASERENENDPTCTEEGSYDEVTRCIECGQLISKETKTINPLGHTWHDDDWSQTDGVTEELFTNANNSNELNYANLGQSDKVYRRDCNRAQDAYELRVDVHQHTPGEAHREDEVAATCTVDGSYNEVVRCSSCQDIISSTPRTITALGHTWEDNWEDVNHDDITDDLFTNSENLNDMSADDVGEEDTLQKRECTRAQDAYELQYSAHEHTNGDAHKENEQNPTCTVGGSYDMVVRCIECSAVISSEHHETDPTGHAWSDENWTRVGVDEIIDTLFTGSENLKDKTPADVGIHDTVDVHLCTNAQDAYELRINVHQHSNGNPVRENEIPATCTEGGSYDEVVYCSSCSEEVSSTPKTTDPLGHSWEDDDWNQIDSTLGTSTLFSEANNTATLNFDKYNSNIDELYRRDCHRAQDAYQLRVNSGHRHTEDEAQRENEIEATCTTAGEYDLVVRCTECREIISSEHFDVDPLGHTWEDNWFNQIKAAINKELFNNAINADSLNYDSLGEHDTVKQRTCTRAHDAYELNVIPHAHNNGEAHVENLISPTCTLGGSYDLVVRCNDCTELISSEHFEVDPLGHTWSNDTWKEVEREDITRTLFESAHNSASYSFDDINPTVDRVFKRLCSRAKDAYEIKVVGEHKHEAGNPYKTNEKSATCTENGSYDEIVKCKVCGDILSNKHVEIEALGHIWHDDDWKLLSSSEVTESLFKYAHNASKLNYSALTANDQVWKRLCDRASDAYELRVTRIELVPTQTPITPTVYYTQYPGVVKTGDNISLLYCLYGLLGSGASGLVVLGLNNKRKKDEE